MENFKKLLTKERLNRICFALLISLLIGIIYQYLSDKALSSFVYKGDFPGFYAPAKIITSLGKENQYDEKLQNQIENEVWRDFDGSFYMSVYPPYFNLILSPIGYFDGIIARHIWMFFSILAYFFTLKILSKLNTDIKNNFLVFFTLGLLFIPSLCGVIGGQNTCFSMFFLSLILYSIKKEKYFLSGIFLSLWCFKPQFAIFYIIPMFLLNKKNFSCGFILGSVINYILGAISFGAFWPQKYLQIVKTFGNNNYVANRSTIVSLSNIFETLKDIFNLKTSLTIEIIFWVFFALLYIYLIYVCIKFKEKEPIYPILLTSILLPYLSFQTLFYDLGISLIALLYYFRFSNKNICYFFLLIVISAILFSLKSTYSYPLFFVLNLLMTYLFFKFKKAYTRQ